MNLIFFILSLSFFSKAYAEVNVERQDFQFEYGLAYHNLKETQKSNGSTGQLTSPQYPFWNAAYSIRISQDTALRFFGGVQFLRFDSPSLVELKGAKQELVQYGIEVTRKLGSFLKVGIFGMKQDHPLYFAKDPTTFEVIRKSFAQSGLHVSLSQRRRIGLLWSIGAKGYVLFPVSGGNVATEAGGGGETYAKLGWVGPLGTMYTIKGSYQIATAPNAEVTFVHEVLAYSANIQYSF
jgi:hypothetical protein